MNSKAHQDYKEQGEKSLPNMLKLLALYHKEKLKKSGEYNIIRQFYGTNNV